MHSTVAALIMKWRGKGYQTQIMNDKITVYNWYTMQLSTPCISTVNKYIVYSASFGTAIFRNVAMCEELLTQKSL